MAITVRSLRSGLGLLLAVPLLACNDGTNPSSVETPQYTIGGSVSGLSGSGLALQNNSGETLALAANGPFTFKTTLTSRASYYVVTATQPVGPVQTCEVSNPTGTIGTASVSNINVVCTDKSNMAADTVAVTTTGITGTGLVLQNNGGDNLPVSADGSFKFALTIPTGSPYEISVLSPPISPYQDCVVTNGSGTAAGSDVANVVVACTVNNNPTHLISGTITGISGTVVLQNNGRDDLTITTNGAFQFALKIPQGSVYDISTKSVAGEQSQTCQFQNARGIVGDHDVTDVVLTCTTNPFPVGGIVTGLPDPDSTANIDLVLQNNLGDDFTVSVHSQSPAAFQFPTPLITGTSYSVTVKTQPGTDTSFGTPGVTQTSTVCVVANGAGKVGNGPVTDIVVNCVRPSAFAYVINGVDNTVAQYIADGATGLLLPVAAPAPTGTGPSCAAAYVSRSLYVCNKASNDLSVYTIDPNTGVLTQAAGSPVAPGLTSPTSVAFQTYANEAELALYVTNSPAGTTPGSVSAFTVGSTPASLSAINQLATGVGPTSGLTYVGIGQTTQRSYLAALNSPDNSLSLYQLNGTTGALTSFQSAVPMGTGPQDIAYHVGSDPASGLPVDLLYVANSGDDTIRRYVADRTTGTLSPTGTNATIGAGPHSLATTAYLYATATQGVFGFTFATDGSLVAMQGNPFAAGTNPIAIAALNNYVYVVNQTDETVSVLSANANSGLLTPVVANTPIKTGHGPLKIVVIQRPDFGPG